jgi:hypothetical protein
MEWYWIVLLVILYLVLGGITSGLKFRAFGYPTDMFGNEEQWRLITQALIWPIIAPILIITYCIKIFDRDFWQ